MYKVALYSSSIKNQVKEKYRVRIEPGIYVFPSRNAIRTLSLMIFERTKRQSELSGICRHIRKVLFELSNLFHKFHDMFLVKNIYPNSQLNDWVGMFCYYSLFLVTKTILFCKRVGIGKEIRNINCKSYHN